MTKMFCVHEFELKSGASEEEFRKFVVEEMFPRYAERQWDVHLAKGDKGERVGKYAIIWATDVETRNAVGGAPGSDPPTVDVTDEGTRRQQKFASMVDSTFTDYVVEFSSK